MPTQSRVSPLANLAMVSNTASENTSTIIRNLALVKLASDIAEHDADEANLPLSDEEVDLRSLLDEAMASAVSRRIFVGSGDDVKDSKSNVDLLREKIVVAVDETLLSLNELRESMVENSVSAAQSDGQAKRKRTPAARRLGNSRKSI